MDSGLTTGDLALMTERNGGGFGGDGNAFIWIFALLILTMGGFGGWGNRGYEPQFATQDFVQNGFNFNDLQSQNRDTMNAISSSMHDVIGVIKDTQTALERQHGTIETSAQEIARQQAQCCCETQKAIMNSDMMNLKNTASITDRITASEMNTNAQIQKVLDQMQANRIEELQNKVNALELQNAMCGVVRYPQNMSYTAGNPPFCNGCGSVRTA